MRNMTVLEEIYQALAYKVTNVSAVADLIGMKRQNLHRKIKSNTLSKEELCKIAKALGGRYITCFSFPDGIIIGDRVTQKKRKSCVKSAVK